MGEALMLRQLSRMSVAILDAHNAVGDAKRAEQITRTLELQLAAVAERLPVSSSTSGDGGAAKMETPEAPRAAESLRIATEGLAPQTPGSPLPNTLHPSKPKTPVTPRDRDGHGRE